MCTRQLLNLTVVSRDAAAFVASHVNDLRADAAHTVGNPGYIRPREARRPVFSLGLQVEFEQRLAFAVVCDVAASHCPVRRAVESRCLVDGQLVAAAAADGVRRNVKGALLKNCWSEEVCGGGWCRTTDLSLVRRALFR